MNSCLYECSVMHRRLQPQKNEFLYRIFLFALDLDELDKIPREVSLFGNNESNIYSFRDTDHIQMTAGSARDNARLFLAQQGVTEEPSRILLLTNTRIFGYIFNPISIWFCYSKTGTPLGAIAEVGNTFGELKPYFVPYTDGAFHLRTPKHFYVSPFSGLDLDFDFRFEPPGNRLGVYIDDYDGEEKTLISTLTGKRVELTSANLLIFTLKYPLLTLRIIFLIHWHAFLLWLKAFPHHNKESNPDRQRGVFRPHKSLQPPD